MATETYDQRKARELREYYAREALKSQGKVVSGGSDSLNHGSVVQRGDRTLVVESTYVTGQTRYKNAYEVDLTQDTPTLGRKVQMAPKGKVKVLGYWDLETE